MVPNVKEFVESMKEKCLKKCKKLADIRLDHCGHCYRKIIEKSMKKNDNKSR